MRIYKLIEENHIRMCHCTPATDNSLLTWKIVYYSDTNIPARHVFCNWGKIWGNYEQLKIDLQEKEADNYDIAKLWDNFNRFCSI